MDNGILEENEAKCMETVEKEELQSIPSRGRSEKKESAEEGEARRRKVPRRGAL